MFKRLSNYYNAIIDNIVINTVVAISYIAIVLLVVDFSSFSDDQISYFSRATNILDSSVHYTVGGFFPILLAFLYNLIGSFEYSLILIYCIIAYLYLILVIPVINKLVKSRIVSVIVGIISLTPHYTLGMTFWGFSGGEFITARILIIPFVFPILYYVITDNSLYGIFWTCIYCILLTLFHLSGFYLLSLVLLYKLIHLLILQKQYDIKKYIPLGFSLFCIVLFYFFIRYINSEGGYLGDSNLDLVYENIISVNANTLSGMTYIEYVSYLWEAYYVAFWWSMFPVRATDLLYVIIENIFLLMGCFLGLRVVYEYDRGLFKRLIAVAVSILIVSYGYQILRFLLFLIFRTIEPSIFEEVRTMRYLYFTVFVTISFLLQLYVKKKSRIHVLVFSMLLIISPFGLLKSIPDLYKKDFLNRTDNFLDPEKQEYVEKALRYNPKDETVNKFLGLLTKNIDKSEFVLTNIHEVKDIGFKGIIAYHDKRTSKVNSKLITEYELSYDQSIIYWYIAYNDVKYSIQSKDISQISKVMNKYNTNYVILPYKLTYNQILKKELCYGDYYLYKKVNNKDT